MKKSLLSVFLRLETDTRVLAPWKPLPSQNDVIMTYFGISGFQDFSTGFWDPAIWGTSRKSRLMDKVSVTLSRFYFLHFMWHSGEECDKFELLRIRCQALLKAIRRCHSQISSHEGRRELDH